MPLPTATGLPIGLNAQFDSDAARSTLIPNDWNLARMKDLGYLVGWAALDAFERETATAWYHVPLTSEAGGDDNWVDTVVGEHIVAGSRALLQEKLALRVGDVSVGLMQLAFEAEGLEPLLTAADIESITPNAVALPRSARDQLGRWRLVFDELGGAEEIDASQALKIIDGDPARGVEWYVEFAALANREDLQSDFLAKPSIMLADGTTTIGPSTNEPWVLVKECSSTALAPRLGIARPIHAAYLDPEEATAAFVVQLEKSGLLYADRDDPADVFTIIGQGAWSDHGPPLIRLEDSDLIALRDGWSNLPRERRLELGMRIGRRVAIRSTWFDSKGIQHRGWDRPVDLYLPVAIDREVDSFAKAAARTPELRWADGEYAKLLRQAAGRTAIGAQNCFRLGEWHGNPDWQSPLMRSRHGSATGSRPAHCSRPCGRQTT